MYFLYQRSKTSKRTKKKKSSLMAKAVTKLRSRRESGSNREQGRKEVILDKLQAVLHARSTFHAKSRIWKANHKEKKELIGQNRNRLFLFWGPCRLNWSDWSRPRGSEEKTNGAGKRKAYGATSLCTSAIGCLPERAVWLPDQDAMGPASFVFFHRKWSGDGRCVRRVPCGGRLTRKWLPD